MIYKRRQFFRTSPSEDGGHGPFPSFHPRSSLPKRFVFVVKSSGIDKFNLVPEGLENHFINPEDGKKLGKSGTARRASRRKALADFGALETFKDRLTIIQKAYQFGDPFHDSEKVAVAPTLDCLLGQYLSTGPYPMYGMAMNGQLLESAGWKPEDSYCYPNLSASSCLSRFAQESFS